MNKKELIDHIDTQRRFNPDYGLDDVDLDIRRYLTCIYDAEWIEVFGPQGFRGSVILCSSCGKLAPRDEFGNINKSNYCSHCGSKMDVISMRNPQKVLTEKK